MAKIMLVVPYAKYFKHFQGDFLKTLAGDGHEVIAAAPDLPQGPCRADVTYKRIPIRNTGLNLFYDLYGLWKLILLLKREQPDILCCYSIKPNLYGSIAARIAGVRRVYLFVTGLGYMFTAKSFKSALIYPLIKRMYGYAASISAKIFFENKDDAAVFRRLGMPMDGKAVVIRGAGVNVERFKPGCAPGLDRCGNMTFLLVARLLRDKGIREYAEAAAILGRRYPGEARFLLLGPYDRNPSAIPKRTVREWVKSGAIEYLGDTGDVRPYLKSANVFVLPSYREGLPKSALEAMAAGLPVITTDAPGCRETVIQGENGFLVKPRDVDSLVQAMEYMIRNRPIVEIMGACSRKIAVDAFDVRKVIGSVKAAMELGHEAPEWKEARR